MKKEMERLIIIESDRQEQEIYGKVYDKVVRENMEREDMLNLLQDFIYYSDKETIRKALKDYNERIKEENSEDDNFYELYEQYERLGLV